LSSKVACEDDLSRAAVIFAAVVFAVVQLAQHDVRWLQLACITSTGTLYRLDQVAFRINGAVAVSPALYYLALYAISGAVLLGEKVLPSR
jgi:hypothetical protein